MDWLRQLPIGQFVDGSSSWLRRLDPRLKLGWTLAFLVTPILAGPLWRIALVGLLLLITALSGLSWRLWRRNLPALLALSLLVGLLSALLPTRAVPAAPISRSPQEHDAGPQCCRPSPQPSAWEEPWETAALGARATRPAAARAPWWSTAVSRTGPQQRHPAVHLDPQRQTCCC